MPSTDIASPSDNDDALQSLLHRIIPYEQAGSIIPHDLMQFGLLGSVIIVGTALLALALPSAEAIRNSDFYILFGNVVAHLDSFMGTIAAPELILGGSLLILDVCLMQVRTTARWRYVVVGQAAIGGAGGVFCTLLLAIVVLNFAIWAVLCALIAWMVGMMIAGWVGGSG